MSGSDRTQVLIVGAGPVGLTLAISLGLRSGEMLFQGTRWHCWIMFVAPDLHSTVQPCGVLPKTPGWQRT